MKGSNATRRTADADEKASGDLLEDAFSRYQGELLGTLYYLVGNVEDAQDALQEAFVRCWRNRRGVGQIKNLRAWIFRIATNVARDIRKTAWRRRRKRLPEDESMLASADSSPEAELTRKEQVMLARRALMDLRPEEQEVFLLRQDGQMTYDEIGRSLHIPSGTVKTRMRAALGKLRVALASKTDDP
jgi:RNA polymerase sigma factor (sigma-70 family)